MRPTARRTTSRKEAVATTRSARLKNRAALIIACVIVVLIVAIGIAIYVTGLPVSITLNGAEVEIGGEKTIAEAMEQENINPLAGNLVAVDGSVLEMGEGEPFSASINGNAVDDTSIKLATGDTVEIGNGADIMESYTAVEEAIPYETGTEGHGAIHLVDGSGTDGIKEIRTGDISGLVAEEVTQEPSNLISLNVSPVVGDDKVIALTFDDSPWPTYTEEILDVLKDNGAKATFFSVGTCIEDNPELTKRAAREGNQIATHTYDHASGSGQSLSLTYMSAEEQVEEVEKGFECITSALGTDVTRLMRAPSGDYTTEVMNNLHSYIIADIGWNIDTEDWQQPGSEAIVEQIESAWPGAIVLMHDGGGDRSQTVEALSEALPYLKSQGYKFVTIDELMEYELEADNS